MDSDYDDDYTYGGIGMHHMNIQQNDNVDSDADDDADNSDDDDHTMIHFKSAKNKDDQIYGVFGTTSFDEGDGTQHLETLTQGCFFKSKIIIQALKQKLEDSSQII